MSIRRHKGESCTHGGEARAIALATGIVATLPAAAGSPAGAAPGHAARTVRSARSTNSIEAVAAPRSGGSLKGGTWITLITGDRVAVNAQGKPVGIEHAKGRADIPVQAQTLAGHTYLIPQDAQRLVAKGRVDRRLFDITTLSRPEYRKAQRTHLGFIVTYTGGDPAARSRLHAADGTEVTHTFEKLDGESVSTVKRDASQVWAALTNEAAGSPYATPESGLETVWLDAIQKASLDKSVP